MVVKEKRGRRRYIVFSISDGTTKDSLIKRFRAMGLDDPPYIIQCVPSKAIIRCSPEQKEDIIGIMSTADEGSRSLMVSGTLKTIRERYPDLKNIKKRTT